MQKLRVSFVAGVTPGKWMDRFTERYPEVELAASRQDFGDILDQLANDQADVVFVRYRGESPKDATRHVIPLYEELEVLCAAKDHDVEYYEETIPEETAASFPQVDLADYPEEVGGIPTAMEVVASGAQVLRVPQSVARLFHRKDVIYRVIEPGAPSMIGIAWPTAMEDTRMVDEFIGIVRGRSANSSRQTSVRNSEQQAKRINDKKKAVAKAKAQEAAKKAKQQAKKQARSGSKGRKRR
ncbi:substrate-binding domain-containing protein [Glutamicibacter sp.]|uniref:substrate-binding domain-containing protein n=1 Tax=Glutamicibacter sp. TaxID=1931995 RepID=UPI0028BD52B5|nr:substrate-binding domain-containing protein [Glutamicibacter sp.]